MPFPEPTHTNHTFLGYRGVSRKHFFIANTKAIRYTPPPKAIAGASQLGDGVYVVSHVQEAIDYALDSAWNYYCNVFKSKDVNDSTARATFEQERWKQWGRVHAVFVPDAKFNSNKFPLADFSHVNIDRTGDFVAKNMMTFIARRPKQTWALKTQLFDKIQTIIYPPHTAALFVKDITEEAWEWYKAN
jgi:hypothetical protein